MHSLECGRVVRCEVVMQGEVVVWDVAVQCAVW